MQTVSQIRNNDPKDVIAKLITESSSDEKERQILAFRSFGNKTRGFRGNFRGNFQNNQSFRYNQNGNNFNNNYNNNWRGRGQARGGRGNRFHSNRRNYNNHGNRSYNVRVAENATSPSDGRGNNNNNGNQVAFTLERANNDN